MRLEIERHFAISYMALSTMIISPVGWNYSIYPLIFIIQAVSYKYPFLLHCLVIQ